MRWSRIFTSCVMTFCFSTGAFGETPEPTDSLTGHSAKQGEAPNTPAQIKEEKELENLKPEEYRLLVLGTQIYLGRFGYGVGPFSGELDPQTQEALRAYQKNVELSETGKITKETLKQLTDDNSILDQILPFLPNFKFEGENWDEMVSAHGTWALENLPVAEALQTSQISCLRKLNLCTVSTAKLAPGYTPTLLSYTNVYEVEVWGEGAITTKPAKTGTCVTTILQIQRNEPSIARLTAFERTQSGACAQVSPKNVRMQLADGSQIYRALKQQKIQDAQRILQVKQTKASKP